MFSAKEHKIFNCTCRFVYPRVAFCSISSESSHLVWGFVSPKYIVRLGFRYSCPINTASTLPFCAKNNPSMRLVRTLGTICTTLHLLITHIIIYIKPLGAKFGNTQQAEVRTSCTFLPSSAKLRNISRPFYIHNSLLVRTSRTFIRHF